MSSPISKFCRFVLVAFLTLGFAAMAEAQDKFDPFRPGSTASSPPQDSIPSSGDNIPYSDSFTALGKPPSSLEKLRFASREEEAYFESCRQDALQSGADISRMNHAAGFLDIRYSDPSCSGFVVDKLLTSMEIALRDDPNALTELQKNPDSRRKFEELKKAYALLSRAEAPQPFKKVPQYTAPQTPNSLSASQFASAPFDDIYGYGGGFFQDDSSRYVSSEWWAQDYSALDREARQRKAERRNSFLRRGEVSITPGGNSGSPLQNSMDSAVQKFQENEDRGRPRR